MSNIIQPSITQPSQSTLEPFKGKPNHQTRNWIISTVTAIALGALASVATFFSLAVHSSLVLPALKFSAILFPILSLITLLVCKSILDNSFSRKKTQNQEQSEERKEDIISGLDTLGNEELDNILNEFNDSEIQQFPTD